MFLGVRQDTKIVIGGTDGRFQRAFHARLPGEPASDATGGPIEHGADFYIRIGFAALLVGCAGLRQEILLQEFVDRFRGVGFSVGTLAFDDSDVAVTACLTFGADSTITLGCSSVFSAHSTVTFAGGSSFGGHGAVALALC